MKIYTRTGDEGNTSLLGGKRLPKYHLRIEAYGTVDELNSFLGLLADQEAATSYQSFIRTLQETLFSVGSHLATEPGNDKVKLPEIRTGIIEELEKSIDQMETELKPLRNFILPGGHPANSMAHVCRSICRRAERRIAELHHSSPIEDQILAIFNRLSDWLFVFSRYMSAQTQTSEIEWNPYGRKG